MGPTVTLSRSRRPGRPPAAAARVISSTPVIALALVVLAWPIPDLLRPHSTFVGSWPSALVLAVHHGFRWGPDVAYTYGPLGFLRLPIPYFEGTLRLSLLYVALSEFALAASLLYVLRRAYGVWVAIALSLLALCLIADERVAITVFVWAVVALRPDAPRVVRTWFAPVAGCLAGLEMLVKFNSGVVVLAIGLVAVLAREGRARHLLALAGSFLGSFVVLWLLAGQRLGDLGSYLHGTAEIVRGYSYALGFVDGDTTGAVVAALLLVALVFAAARHAVREDPPRLSWAVYPLWGLAGFLVFKEGFVRSDTGHRPIFFGFALGALLALAAQRRILGRALLATAAAALAAAWSYQGSDLSVPAPASSLGGLVSQLRAAASTRSGAREAAHLRARLRRVNPVDSRTRAALGNARMTILGEEDSVAFAYHLHWQPLFTVQRSQAYTTWLDQRTARILRARNGPQRILRSPRPTLDHRNTVWDPPAVIDTMMCRYAQVSVTTRWQVLARVPSRCGRPVTRTTVHARLGQRVNVPPYRRDAAMLVHIRGAQPAGLAVLEGLAYRPDIRRIQINGHDYRLVPATAADGLVLWVPPADDYTGAFALSPRVTRLALRAGSGLVTGARRLTYQFVDVPLRPFPRTR